MCIEIGVIICLYSFLVYDDDDIVVVIADVTTGRRNYQIYSIS